MYVALICMDPVGSCNTFRVLRVIPVEGKISFLVCACVNRFVPSICSKQTYMPGCAFMCTISMCSTSPEAFLLCGFSSFHSLPCSFSKKGKALRSELRQVR